MSLPLHGEYFVFELDPVASIATFDDPIATKACEDMTNKQYLACVLQWQGGIPVVDYPCALDIMLVSTRGLVAGPEDGMLPEMSCPILPNTSSHPLGREPVHCTPPLPWPNCFHPTLARTTVRIQYESQDTRDRGEYQLVPQDEAVHLIDLHEHDAEWRQEIGAAYQELHEAEHDTRSSRSSYNANESSPSVASISSLQVPVSFDEWLDETPIVKFSFDLETISAQDISNPWEYQEEHDAYTKVLTEAKRRLHQKMQETRKLDDELFPAPHFAPDSKSLDQPDPAEDSAPASPHTRFHGNGQAVLSDWSSEYEEPARSVVLDDSTSSKASVSASQADRNTAAPPSAIDPRERLKAALDLEPHKVSNAPLTQMPDREEYITWEREINIKMDQMFAEITARDKKQDKEGTDDAIVKRTHLQMLCLPNPRPKHMEALAAVFQRERESLLASPKPEAIASTGVPKTNNGPRVSGLLGSLKKLGMFFGCRSSATASTDTDALHSPSQPRSAPSGSLFERLRRKVFGKL